MIANTGQYNRTVIGGGTKLDVDGIIGTKIQEAKFISNLKKHGLNGRVVIR
jgi:hypothetical protein